MAKDILCQSGIYEILNKVNGKSYIGSTADFKIRWRLHKTLLRKGKHHSRKLQNSWTKYGEDSFHFKVVESVIDVGRLIEREQHWFDTLNPALNICKIAGSCRGVKRTEEYRRNLSAARKGKKASEDARLAMSAAAKLRPPPILSAEAHARGTEKRRGAKRTEEQRQKMSASHTGKKRGPLSEETKIKISLAHKGKKVSDEERARLTLLSRQRVRGPLSEETKRKIGLAGAGKKRPKSPEAIAKHAAAMRGVPRPSMRGRKQSPEALEKRLAAIRLYHLNKRMAKEAANETIRA